MMAGDKVNVSCGNWTDCAVNPNLNLVNHHDPYNIVGIAGVIAICIMICMGTVGSLLVLLAVIKCQKLQKSYNYIIAALAVTDLMFNTLIMPLYADSYLHRRWRFSAELCRLNTFLGTMVVMSTALHIGCIALNRYVLIVMPHFYRHIAQRKAIACQIAFIWILSFLTVLPGILGWHAVVAYSDQIGRCNYVRSKSKTSLYFIFSIGFLLPCAIMTFAYSQIYFTIHRSMRSLNTHHDEAARMSPRFFQRTPDQHKTYTSVPLVLCNNGTGENKAVPPNDSCLGKKHSVSDGSRIFKNGTARAPEDKKECIEMEALEKSPSDRPVKPLCKQHLHIADPGKLSPEESSVVTVTPRQSPCPSPHPSHHFTSHRPHLDSTARRLQKRDVRIIHMILIVFLTFSLTYLPFTVLNFVDQEGTFGREWYMLTSLAFWAGACVNPWIYGIMNKQFREAYRDLLCKWGHTH